MESLNSRRVGRIGIHGVEPFLENEEVHPPEEAVQDDKTSDNFKPEDNTLGSEAGVEALNDDTHAHVEDADNDRGSHLDTVNKSQVLG